MQVEHGLSAGASLRRHHLPLNQACSAEAPLLRGALASRAQSALADLSVYFQGLAPSDVPGVSLWSGLPGVALAHAALARVAPRRGHRGLAETALDHALGHVARAPSEAGLSGLAGLGWVVERVVGRGVELLCSQLDAQLEAALRGDHWRDTFDLIGGLAGIGVYALERVRRPSGRRILAQIVRCLGEMATVRRPGLAWRCDPRWKPDLLRARPYLAWDLGVAHGVPGVIAFLGRVAAADVDAAVRDRASSLLGGAVAWLLTQQLPGDAEGCFAIAAGRGAPRAAARVAWCYGDLGVSAALLVAARAIGEPTWEREAVRIALRAAAREEGRSGVVDAGLCHGAAGVAHVLHRLHLQTRDERLADASRTWFARTLAMRAEGRGSVGSRARSQDAQRRPHWKAEPGFLSGAAGIALALVAATTGEDPAWDRALLIS